MQLTLEQYERISPRSSVSHGGVKMTFSTPNTATQWRVQSILTKEPCTLEWIAGFEEGAIVVDGGANVGMPFAPNSLFVFLKTDSSFHGVEPVSDPDTRRWLLLYDIFCPG